MRHAQKLLGWVPLLTVVVCAILAARTMNQLISAWLLVPPPAHTAAPRRAAPPAPARSKEIDGLVARNMFCSDCAPAAAGGPVAAAAASDGRPPLSALPLALVATVTTRDPARSAATIVARDGGRGGLYAVGDPLPGAAELRAIRASSVELWNPETRRLERLELIATSAPPAVAATAPAAPSTAPRGPENEFISAVEKGVRKVSSNRYEVDRALIDRILGDPSALMRTASVMPAVKDGKAAGFRLRNVRGGSIYASLGLQSGDTIRAVNGTEITGPDSALAAYAKLKEGGTFALSVERGGQPMQMEYAIR